MSVKSRIFVTEAVENKNRRTKADENYFVVYVQQADGSLKPALFTDGDLQKAFKRADANAEDVLPPYMEPVDVEVTTEQKSWLAKIFG